MIVMHRPDQRSRDLTTPVYDESPPGVTAPTRCEARDQALPEPGRQRAHSYLVGQIDMFTYRRSVWTSPRCCR